MSSRLKLLGAAALLAVLTCAYTWPLPIYATSAVAHDRGDPLLVTWILWWTSRTVPLTASWWNAPAFYPSPGVLAYSENLLSLAPLTAPIVWVTHSPLLAYNAAFLLSYVLCGLSAYALGWVLTRSHSAAFVAAIAFAFAPYRLSHTQHLQLLSSYWMPLALAALHLYAASPSWRWALAFAFAWLCQALASGYYLFFLTILVLLWLACFVPRRLTLRHLRALAVAWTAAGCLLLPILLGYRAVHAEYGFRRSPVEAVNYSADVVGILAASPDSLVWSRIRPAVSAESEQFPGVTILLVLLLAAKMDLSPFSRKRGQVHFWFYVAAAVVMWLLSLGPEPRIAGNAIGIPGPYAVLARLPGFDGIRVPARFWMLATMCLAAAGALGIARIEARRTRRIAAAVAVAGLLLDGWPRHFPVVAAPGSRVTATAARVRLGLPLHESETETMYGAIPQARPVFNGYSGYAAPQHAALRDLLEHHDGRILARLAAAEPIEVIVESAGDADGRWSAFVQAQPGVRRIANGPDWTAYELPATGAVARGAPAGVSIPIAAIETTSNVPDINAVRDGDLETRWHVAAQAGGETITVDVGTPQRVTAVVLCLGTYAGQYPRGLDVEVSTDGRAWQLVRSGGTALDVYDAALRVPREIPIALPIERDAVRYVRLRQTGREPRTGWTIVELRVLGS